MQKLKEIVFLGILLFVMVNWFGKCLYSYC